MIRHKLIGLFLIALAIPVVALVWLVGPWTERAFRNQAIQVSGQFTTQAAGYLQLYFSGLEEVPSLLLEGETVQSVLDYPAFDSLYSVVEQSWEIDRAIRRFVGRRTDIERLDLYGRNGFGFEAGRPVLGRYHSEFHSFDEASSNNRWSFDADANALVLHHLFRTEAGAGGVVMYVPAHRIRNILERFRISDSSFIAMVAGDETGEVSVVQGRHESAQDPLSGTALTTVMAAREANSPLGAASRESVFRFNGDQYIAFLSTLRPDEIGLMVVVSVDELLAPVRDLRYVTFGVLLAAALMSFVSASVVSRRLISAPLENLSRTMDRFPSLEATPRAPVETMDEIGHLARRYNAMVDRIDELVVAIQQEEQQRQHAQWTALQAQINPHFLYNTLNSISWLARSRKVPAIADMASSLGDLFKYALQEDDGWVSVTREMENIRAYLRIQKHRYGDRLVTEIDCDPDFSGAAVPKFVLQPIVENAVEHAVEPSPVPVTISVRATRIDDGALELTVEDGGQFLDDETLSALQAETLPRSGHIGIAYVRERLAHLRRASGTMTISRAESGGLCVAIRIGWVQHVRVSEATRETAFR